MQYTPEGTLQINNWRALSLRTKLIRLKLLLFSLHRNDRVAFAGEIKRNNT